VKCRKRANASETSCVFGLRSARYTPSPFWRRPHLNQATRGHAPRTRRSLFTNAITRSSNTSHIYISNQYLEGQCTSRKRYIRLIVVRRCTKAYQSSPSGAQTRNAGGPVSRVQQYACNLSGVFQFSTLHFLACFRQDEFPHHLCCRCRTIHGIEGFRQASRLLSVRGIFQYAEYR
jgi:hypothetical protein